MQHDRDDVAGVGRQSLDGVDRAEDLLQRRAVVLELEADGLTLAGQPVGAAGEAVPVDSDAGLPEQMVEDIDELEDRP